MKAKMLEKDEITLGENLEQLQWEINQFCGPQSSNKDDTIPPSLENYLKYVAKTGNTVFPWCQVRPLFRLKMLAAIADFSGESPSANEEFVLERFDLFRAAPFTIQRFSELIIEPHRHYKLKEKFLRGLEKTVLVVSTIEPRSFNSSPEAEAELNDEQAGDEPMSMQWTDSTTTTTNETTNGHTTLDAAAESSVTTFMPSASTSSAVHNIDSEESSSSSSSSSDSSSSSSSASIPVAVTSSPNDNINITNKEGADEAQVVTDSVPPVETIINNSDDNANSNSSCLPSSDVETENLNTKSELDTSDTEPGISDIDCSMEIESTDEDSSNNSIENSVLETSVDPTQESKATNPTESLTSLTEPQNEDNSNNSNTTDNDNNIEISPDAHIATSQVENTTPVSVEATESTSPSSPAQLDSLSSDPSVELNTDIVNETVTTPQNIEHVVVSTTASTTDSLVQDSDSGESKMEEGDEEKATITPDIITEETIQKQEPAVEESPIEPPSLQAANFEKDELSSSSIVKEDDLMESRETLEEQPTDASETTTTIANTSTEEDLQQKEATAVSDSNATTT